MHCTNMVTSGKVIVRLSVFLPEKKLYYLYIFQLITVYIEGIL